MDRIKSFVPMMAFCLLFLKGLIQSFDTNSVIALFILGLLYSVLEFRTENSQINQLKSDIEQLKEKNSQIEKKSEELRTHVNSLKLAQQIKPAQFR